MTLDTFHHMHFQDTTVVKSVVTGIPVWYNADKELVEIDSEVPRTRLWSARIYWRTLPKFEAMVEKATEDFGAFGRVTCSVAQYDVVKKEQEIKSKQVLSSSLTKGYEVTVYVDAVLASLGSRKFVGVKAENGDELIAVAKRNDDQAGSWNIATFNEELFSYGAESHKFLADAHCSKCGRNLTRKVIVSVTPEGEKIALGADCAARIYGGILDEIPSWRTLEAQGEEEIDGWGNWDEPGSGGRMILESDSATEELHKVLGAEVVAWWKAKWDNNDLKGGYEANTAEALFVSPSRLAWWDKVKIDGVTVWQVMYRESWVMSIIKTAGRHIEQARREKLVITRPEWAEEGFKIRPANKRKKNPVVIIGKVSRVDERVNDFGYSASSYWSNTILIPGSNYRMFLNTSSEKFKPGDWVEVKGGTVKPWRDEEKAAFWCAVSRATAEKIEAKKEPEDWVEFDSFVSAFDKLVEKE
jgi:hypothetical protein